MTLHSTVVQMRYVTVLNDGFCDIITVFVLYLQTGENTALQSVSSSRGIHYTFLLTYVTLMSTHTEIRLFICT